MQSRGHRENIPAGMLPRDRRQTRAVVAERARRAVLLGDAVRRSVPG